VVSKVSSQSRTIMMRRRSNSTCEFVLIIFGAFCALRWVDGFVPSAPHSTQHHPSFKRSAAPAPLRRALSADRSSPSSSLTSFDTALFGIRSAIRRKLSSSRILKRLQRPTDTVDATADAVVTSVAPPSRTDAPQVSKQENSLLAPRVAAHEDASSFSAAMEKQRSPNDRLTPAVTLLMEKEQKPKHLVSIQETQSENIRRVKTAASSPQTSLYSLPLLNRGRDLTTLEREFRSMLQDFANYSHADILSVADPQKRVIFEGVAASAHSQPVYRAFEVLFEDLLPVRLAGRLIFKGLKEFMAESIRQREADVQTVIQQTGLEEDLREIQEIRLMFVSTASQLNHDNYLTLDQVAETGMITSTATEVLGFDSASELLERLDEDQNGKLSFVELMNGLWKCASDMCGLENCNPSAVLHNLLVELNENPPATPETVLASDAKRERFVKRYNEMVAAFIEWKDLMPPDPTADDPPESRRMAVVRGCFHGAENIQVVDALRICYVEYAGLRIAGDVIFKLASSFLGDKKKRSSSR